MTGEPTARAIEGEIPILVTDDIPCRKCSYNLRGLFGDGRCPECGTPVGVSLRGDLLRYADPEWVKKLALGIRYIFLGILVALILGAIGGLVAAVSSAALGQAISILAGIVSYYGTWLLTEPDPSGLGEDPTVTSRKFIRISLLFGIFSQGFSLLVENSGIPEWLRWVAIGFVGLAALIGFAGQFAQFTYFRTLARRIPDEKLAKRASFLRWAYVVPLAIATVVGLVVAFGFPAVGPGGPSTLGGGPGAGAGMGFAAVGGLMVFVCGASVAVIIFGIMTIQLMWTLGKRFKEQAELAGQNWEEAQDPASLVAPSSSQ